MKKISLLTLLCCLMASQALFAQAKLEDPLPKDPNTVAAWSGFRTRRERLHDAERDGLQPEPRADGEPGTA